MSSSRVSPTILSNIGSKTYTIRYEPDIKNILFFSRIKRKKINRFKKNVLFSCIRPNPKGFSCIFSKKIIKLYFYHVLKCKIYIVNGL